MSSSQAFNEVSAALGLAMMQDSIAMIESKYKCSIPQELWLLLAYEHGIEQRGAYQALLAKLAKIDAVHALLAYLYWNVCLTERFGSSEDIAYMADSLSQQFGVSLDAATHIVDQVIEKVMAQCVTEQSFEQVTLLFSVEEFCYMLRYGYVCSIGSKATRKIKPLIQDVLRDIEDEIAVLIEDELNMSTTAAEAAADVVEHDNVQNIPHPINIPLSAIQDPAQAQLLWQTFNDALQNMHDDEEEDYDSATF